MVALPLVLDSMNYTDYTYPAYICQITAAVMNLPRNPINKIPHHKPNHQGGHERSLGPVKQQVPRSRVFVFPFLSTPILSPIQSNPAAGAIPSHSPNSPTSNYINNLSLRSWKLAILGYLSKLSTALGFS